MSEALTGIRTLRAKDMIGGRKPVVSRKLKFMTKHVESLLVPRLDEGSNPSISTKKNSLQISFCKLFFLFKDISIDFLGL